MKLKKAWIMECKCNLWDISIIIADMKKIKKLILTVEEIENIIDMRSTQRPGLGQGEEHDKDKSY